MKKLIPAIIASFLGLVIVNFVRWAPAAPNAAERSLEQFYAANEPRALLPLAAERPPAEGATRTPILVYHAIEPHQSGESRLKAEYTVAPEVFERQLQYLQENGYRAISFDVLTAHLTHGLPVPDRAVVITLDDGDDSQYEYALPLLEKYGLTATFFIYPNAIGKSRFLTWEQLGEAVAQGMAVGSHAATHPFLTKTTDEKELEREIAGSKRWLAERLGVEVKYFSHPFGLTDERVNDLVRQAGYQAARTLSWETWNKVDDLYALRAVIVTDNFSRFRQILGER